MLSLVGHPSPIFFGISPQTQPESPHSRPLPVKTQLGMTMAIRWGETPIGHSSGRCAKSEIHTCSFGIGSTLDFNKKPYISLTY